MEWTIEKGLVAYEDALTRMDARARAIQAGEASEWGWSVEHPPLYTAGTSANVADLLGGTGFPVYATGRGGQYTYHGPGQRVVYLMLDLKKRAQAKGAEPDLRAYVKQLEAWVISVLERFGVEGFIREGRVGVWVATPTGEAKIAALGVRVSKWVTSHGIALNVNPDLGHYAGIVPCGIREFGVTSLEALGVSASMEEVDAALKERFEALFGA